MKLRYHPQVQRELSEAVAWYDEQRSGLGDDFFAGFTAALQQISERPGTFNFWLGSKKVRRLRLKRFPYDILFEIFPDRVRILCLRHVKRHPSYGLHRR